MKLAARIAAMTTLLAAGAGCRGDATVTGAELLVVSADSTFWIREVNGRVQVRGAPLLVARIDGRFRELYVVDDDRTYADAVFVGHRLFSRDLVRGDSIELHHDTTVTRLADEYIKAHPDEQPLGDDEPESDNPSIHATSDVELLGLHGPYLSLEHHLDIDGRPGVVDHHHAFRRLVLDARSGRPMTAAALFGATEGARVIAAARKEWDAGRATLLADGRTVATARRALGEFTFDSNSFTLGSSSHEPTIRFVVPASGTRPNLEPVELSVQDVKRPDWWADAAREAPAEAGDRSWWTREADTLDVTASSRDGGWTLRLEGRGAGIRAAGRLSSAVERVIWLDPSVAQADRKALERAFAEAATYDGSGQVASATRTAPFTAVAHHLDYARNERARAARAPRERVAPRVVRADDAAGRERARPRVRRRHPGDARQDGGRVRDPARADAVRDGVGRSRGLPRAHHGG